MKMKKCKMKISCDVQLFVSFNFFAVMVAGEKGGSRRWPPQNCQVSIERNSLVFWYFSVLVDDHKRGN